MSISSSLGSRSTLQLERTISENLKFIDEGGVLNPESPHRWVDTVEATKEFLTTPGTQGKNPAGELHTSVGDRSEISFLTLHHRRPTRIRPHDNQLNLVQWPGQDRPQLQERTGDDDFPVFWANKPDSNIAVTVGVERGEYTADRIVTVYENDQNVWDGERERISIPDLSERGCSEHPAGGLQFEKMQWQVTMAESKSPVIELREKYRNENGQLITPESPTALLEWKDSVLTWKEL